MKLSGKLTWRFIVYFLSFYFMLFIGTTIIVVLFIMKILTGYYYHDIRALEKYELERGVIEQDGTVTFSESLLNIAERSGGILQIVDSDGTVLQSSKEGVLPTFYRLDRLVKQGDFFTWQLENGQIVLFQDYTIGDELLHQLHESKTFPELSKADEQLLTEQGATFELYNSNGELLYSTSSKTPSTLPIETLLRANAALNERDQLVTYEVLVDGNIAVIRMPNTHFDALTSLDSMMGKIFLKWFGIFHIFLLVFTLGFSLLIGRQYGKPIFYFLLWIEQLSKKDYSRPNDKKIRRKKDRRLKRKYRMYEEIDQSLHELTTKLQDNERKILQTERLREDWITGLSHDLKTPLSTIHGYSVMLASDHHWSDEEIQLFATTMLEKSTYMDALINDLTYTYQLKSDGVVFQKEQTEMVHYTTTYIEKNSQQAVAPPTATTPIYAEIDRTRFERVLENIVGNALKYTAAGTPISVNVFEDSKNVVIEVRDKGEGIPKERLDHLFNRYYRATNTTTDDSGTGLGLTIAKQLVEAHGGTIEVETSSEGTTISIRLPR